MLSWGGDKAPAAPPVPLDSHLPKQSDRYLTGRRTESAHDSIDEADNCGGGRRGGCDLRDRGRSLSVDVDDDYAASGLGSAGRKRNASGRAGRERAVKPISLRQLGDAGVAPSATVPAPASSNASALQSSPAAVVAAAPSAPAGAAKPSFDVVRIDPSGDAVIAGRSEPRAQVSLTLSGKPVAQAQADADGQFVMLPPKLPPGDHVLGLRATGASGEVVSEQSVAIAVPDRGARETVAALAAPNKPTVVLSQPSSSSAVSGLNYTYLLSRPCRGAPCSHRGRRQRARTCDCT